MSSGNTACRVGGVQFGGSSLLCIPLHRVLCPLCCAEHLRRQNRCSLVLHGIRVLQHVLLQLNSHFARYKSADSVSLSLLTTQTCAGLAGVVNAALIGVVLLWLTPVFRHMPLNALAAIVITGVMGLLDFPRVFFLFKASMMNCSVAGSSPSDEL